jgi:hypothetical protein
MATTASRRSSAPDSEASKQGEGEDEHGVLFGEPTCAPRSPASAPAPAASPTNSLLTRPRGFPFALFPTAEAPTAEAPLKKPSIDSCSESIAELKLKIEKTKKELAAGCFKSIFDAKASDGNAMRRTALIKAVAMEHEELIEELLDHHADPSLAGSDGITPLHAAAQVGNLSILDALLTWVHVHSLSALCRQQRRDDEPCR